MLCCYPMKTGPFSECGRGQREDGWSVWEDRREGKLPSGYTRNKQRKKETKTKKQSKSERSKQDRNKQSQTNTEIKKIEIKKDRNKKT